MTGFLLDLRHCDHFPDMQWPDDEKGVKWRDPIVIQGPCQLYEAQFASTPLFEAKRIIRCLHLARKISTNVRPSLLEYQSITKP
jgi:hypothetical protein